MSKRVAIVDYGAGNHQSVANALDTLGYKFVISHRVADIESASTLILPGVGAFGPAMAFLRECRLDHVLREQVLVRQKPMLGICLGMQLLAEDSTENGLHKGLGVVPGHVVAIPADLGIKVPHVGWNDVKPTRRAGLFSRVPNHTAFYFDHSYHFLCKPAHQAAAVTYGTNLEMVAAVEVANIFGVQFHPEKSHRAGLKLFRTFFDWCGIEGRPC